MTYKRPLTEEEFNSILEEGKEIGKQLLPLCDVIRSWYAKHEHLMETTLPTEEQAAKAKIELADLAKAIGLLTGESPF